MVMISIGCILSGCTNRDPSTIIMGGPTIPAAPSAQVSWSPSPANPLVITCRAKVTGGVPISGPVKYEIAWDFYFNGSVFNPMAAGEEVSVHYPKSGTYIVACRIRDRVADHQDPDRRPLFKTMEVVANDPQPPAPPPSVSLSYYRDIYNPMIIHLHATVAGGLPQSKIPGYEIGWDFNYDGIKFDTMAAGVDVSVEYTTPGEHTVACRVRDAIPDSQDPDHRPVIRTIKVYPEKPTFPSPPSVAITAKVDQYNPKLVRFQAFVSGGVPRDTLPLYIIAWDYDYNGVAFNTHAAGSQVSKLYSEPGEYTVACRVEDAISSQLDPKHRPVIKTIDIKIE